MQQQQDGCSCSTSQGCSRSIICRGGGGCYQGQVPHASISCKRRASVQAIGKEVRADNANVVFLFLQQASLAPQPCRFITLCEEAERGSQDTVDKALDAFVRELSGAELQVCIEGMLHYHCLDLRSPLWVVT